MNARIKISISIILFIFSGYIIAQEIPSKEYIQHYQEVWSRTQWWRDARFGMFIHFGPAAVLSNGMEGKSRQRLTNEQYQKYVDAFYPSDLDAKKWAKAAKGAGMKYAVLTAKHHDGFCLFDSQLTDYKISAYFSGRDIVREFLDAFRAEGLRVGLYYSIIDWHHADYPNVGNHPLRSDKEYAKQGHNWDNYLKYMHGQVEELVTNYGKIDIMWLDFSFDGYTGEKWKSKELVNMVRQHQPDILLNNRLEINHGTVATGRPIGAIGDFETPEQGIPDSPLTDQYGNPVPWEACITFNEEWGYTEKDKEWKSPELIVHSLVNCVSKNGNLLLNVGPDARGNIPEENLSVLAEVGQWMEKNSESIYGCGASSVPKPEWGRITQKENTVFVHWMYPALKRDINIRGLDKSEKSAYMLGSGAELTTYKTWFGNDQPGNFYINIQYPDGKVKKIDTVIKIESKQRQNSTGVF